MKRNTLSILMVLSVKVSGLSGVYVQEFGFLSLAFIHRNLGVG